MKMQAFSVWDMKVQAFMTPFFARSLGEAMRSFEDACKDDKSPFFRHPEDFQLWCVGDFDDAAGDLGPVDHKLLCNASDYVIPRVVDLSEATSTSVSELRKRGVGRSPT